MKALPLRPAEQVAAIAAVCIAAIATTIWSGSIPGLHADEAWSLLRIAEILEGQHQLNGMNYYTGVLHHYVALPAVAVLGPVPAALRLTGAALNVLAVVALVALLARLDSDRPLVRFWTPLLVAASANFVIHSRFAIEVTMLMPLLFLAAAVVMIRAPQAPSLHGVFLAGLAGIFVGLAVYSHLLAAAVAAGMAIGLVVGFGPRVIFHRLTIPLLAGGALGLAPRFIALAHAAVSRPPDGIPAAAAPAAAAPNAARIAEEVLGRFADIAYSPWLVGRLLDGDVLFLRTTGQILLPVVPALALALVGFGVWQMWARPWRLSPLDRALLASFVASLAIVILISPRLSLHYFVLHGTAAIYLLVRLVAAWASHPGSRNGVAHGLFAVLMASQVVIGGSNYFLAFHGTGGTATTFPIGFRMMETSSHFIRSDSLHAALAAAGFRTVYANDFIAWPLAAHGLTAGGFKVRSAGHTTRLLDLTRDPLPLDDVAIVIYVSPPGPNAGTLGGASDIVAAGGSLARAAGFDPRFAVFRWTGPKASAP